MHVSVSPRTESGWTRKNTDCCSRCARIRTIEPARGHHRSAGKFRPQRLHLLVLQRRSHVKYRRMHHTRSPLSATACRLLLNKLHVGESSPSSVDLSSHFQCILELARAEYPELNIEHNSMASKNIVWPAFLGIVVLFQSLSGPTTERAEGNDSQRVVGIQFQWQLVC